MSELTAEQLDHLEWIKQEYGHDLVRCQVRINLWTQQCKKVNDHTNTIRNLIAVDGQLDLAKLVDYLYEREVELAREIENLKDWISECQRRGE